MKIQLFFVCLLVSSSFVDLPHFCLVLEVFIGLTISFISDEAEFISRKVVVGFLEKL